MSKNHLEQRVEETWRLQEKSKKTQGREAKVVGEGVILEEAIVRCGSREQLHAANPDIHAAIRSQGLTSVAMEVSELIGVLGSAALLSLPSTTPTPTIGLGPVTCGSSSRVGFDGGFGAC